MNKKNVNRIKLQLEIINKKIILLNVKSKETHNYQIQNIWK